MDEPRVDRSAFSVIPLDGDRDDVEYWLTKSPEERLEALETMRRLQYGERATQDFKEFLRFTDSDRNLGMINRCGYSRPVRWAGVCHRQASARVPTRQTRVSALRRNLA